MSKDQASEPSISDAGDDLKQASGTSAFNVLDHPLPSERRAAAAGTRSNGRSDQHDSFGDPTIMTGMDRSGVGIGYAAPRLDSEYYAKWRAETAAKVANGEDYYADFERRAKERAANEPMAKMVSNIKGVFTGRRKSKDGSGKKEDGQAK